MMTAYWNGRRSLVGFSFRKIYDLLREGARRLKEHRVFSGIIYCHQLRITIGQMVEDLALIAAATVNEEWVGRIEYLPLG